MPGNPEPRGSSAVRMLFNLVRNGMKFGVIFWRKEEQISSQILELSQGNSGPGERDHLTSRDF